MRHIEAFSTEQDRESWFCRTGKHEFAIYLAGGISDIDDWQDQFISHFKQLQSDTLMKALYLKNLTIINPRRNHFNDKRSEIKKQIMWEHAHAKAADALVFYFPADSHCSISLFQYGKYLTSGKKIFVGIEKDHLKSLDIFAHTRIEKPDQNINYSITDLIEEVQNYIEGS